MTAAETTAVIHLVRAANGAMAFSDFVTSVRNNPPGEPYDLILLCKGFGKFTPKWVHDLAPSDAVLMELPDRGLDIGPYARAAAVLDHPIFCFLNSFSRPLAPDWLKKLNDALRLEGVGAAGATGSWQSHYSYGYHPDWENSLPWQPGRWPRWLVRRYRWMRFRLSYPPHPNPHLRTNGFVVRNTDFRSLKISRIWRKDDAYRFESGYRSMTRQLEHQGLRVVVVDREGRAHGVDQWRDSHTFWSGEQNALLIADNQTEAYASGDSAMRRALAHAAWESRRFPDPPKDRGAAR